MALKHAYVVFMNIIPFILNCKVVQPAVLFLENWYEGFLLRLIPDSLSVRETDQLFT